MSIHLAIEGRTVDAGTQGVLAGFVVRAFLGQGNRPIASSITNDLGAFTLSIDAARHAVLEPGAVLTLGLCAPGSDTLFFRSAPLRLKRWPREGLTIAVPDAARFPSHPRPVRRANSSSSAAGKPVG